MSAKPARPANSANPLAVNRTPLSDDVAAPPAPVPGAPEGTVAGGMYGAVVAGDVGGVTTIVVVDSGESLSLSVPQW